MTLSIIIITFNNFNELINTINSCLHISSTELIVINGGKCKQTSKFLNDSNISNLKYISEPDRGISDAFNKGVRTSTGDFITFLNSGDILVDPFYYSKAIEILSNPKYDYIHSNIIFSDSIAGDIILTPHNRNIGFGMPVFHQTLIVNRKIFNEVGLFNLNFKIAMDYDFVVRMFKAKYVGYYLNRPTVKMDGKGISSTSESKSIRECYKSLKINHELNAISLYNLSMRYLRFLARSLLMKMKLGKIITKYKINKSNSKLQ